MENKRRRHSSELKTKVALEAIRGEMTVAQIASRYEVHSIQVGKWKKQALDGFPTLFQRGHSGHDGQSQEELVSLLYREIGQLKVELDWLKKKSGGHS